MELNFKIKEKSEKYLELRKANLSNFKKRLSNNKRDKGMKFTDLEKILSDNFKELNNDILKIKDPELMA